MPIAPLTSGEDFRQDFKNKLNEIVAWINTAENCKLNPGSGGKVRLPQMIDLRNMLTKDEARQAGLNI